MTLLKLSQNFAIRSCNFYNAFKFARFSNARKASNFKAPPRIREGLFCNVKNPVKDSSNKITVVGAGMVGIACANAILFQRISSHVALVDAFPKKVEGEALDFRHGSVFLNDARIECSTDFSVSGNSKVVIITAGVRQEKGESRLNLAKRNAEIMKKIIPPLVKCSPEAVFIMVTNPVDILTWVMWKVSGLPFHKVIGSGTHLDSARLRCMIADRIHVSPSSVQGYVVGEHGDTQVPLWSGVSVAGVQLRDISPSLGLDSDEEKWNGIAEIVKESGAQVRTLKGYSNTAIGLSVADIAKAVLGNVRSVKTVSTLVQGHYCINHEMFLSLPCIIAENGVTQITRVRMTEIERKLLQTSADSVYQAQKGL